jgi:eukaryotic-like serine/threonine-protein kinase
MTPAQWDHVCALFEQALERPPSERQAFVDSLDEPLSVRRELASLLAEHDDEAHSILEMRIAPLAAELALQQAGGDELPASIGPYQPVRELGRGGMGVVYLARRVDGQFEQDVALKLVRRGMESDEVRRRFLLERQLLARLQHPGIARLLDGGITADGRAWFALEYVQGVPLYDYCRDAALDLDGRLRLFLKVCEAVAYAHRNLVVHRDLKPGNILVTATGEPRLLDFGIAKLLEEDAQPDTPHTRASLVLVTPEYGAPEQVAGEPITTATDVYALGMILYELLTGKRPYDLTTRSPLEMYEVILNTHPTRPSLAARGERSESAPRWARELRGDLDIIVMKALAKSQDRRYATAAALAHDIERYLEGRPIEARPDSVLYVTRKFLRRHWLPAGAAALVLASLIGGLAAAAWQGGIASREARRAESISTFLFEMLSSIDPNKAQGRDVTVREVLDEAARRLDEGETSVAGVPVVESAIRATVGSTYRALGQYEAAERQAVSALELSLAALGESHWDTICRMSELGDIYFEWGRIDEAERWYLEARRVATGAFGEEHELAEHAATQLAGILFRRGDYAGAERELTAALEASRRTHGAENEKALLIQARLASSIGAQGRLEESAALLADTLAVQERVMGERNRTTLMTMGNLGNVYQLLERYDDAVSLGKRAYAIAVEVLPADHPEMLETMGRLATMYFEAGENAEAEPLFEEALARHVDVLGEGHWRTLVFRANYAALLAETGRRDRALAEWSVSIDGLTSSLGAEHPMTVEIIGMRDEALGGGE